jgi:hypothetical protein
MPDNFRSFSATNQCSDPANAKPRFPVNRPADISPEDWLKLSQNPGCARLIDCGSLCQPVDEDGFYDVQVDHIISRAKGGTSTFDNLRPVCACYNNQKGPKPDPDFSGAYYFDQEIDTSKLRQHQRELAYEIAQISYRDLFMHDLALVMPRALLFAWMTGAGKTIGVCAFLFGFNQLRAPFNARRIRRVLWMVHQRELVNLIGEELRTELTKWGICAKAPTIYTPDSAEMILARPTADIVITCPQMLWSKEAGISNERRQYIMAQFDAIVIDEGHFGIDRYLEILTLAPAALKIVATATPMDADGKLLCDVDNGRFTDKFTLVSAVGYAEGRAAGIYKKLHSLTDGEQAGHYVAVEGGEADLGVGEQQRPEVNTRQPLNVIRTTATIETALAKTTAIAPSIIIRVNSREKAKLIAQQINSDSELCEHGALALYSGVKGVDQLAHPENPWMQIKKTGGFLQTPPTGARFLICVDMGQFGLNNAYCGTIGWRDSSLSLIELIQRIGRALRAVGVSQDGDGQIVKLIWKDDPAFRRQLELSLYYMLHLETELRRFRTLRDLSNPTKFEPEDTTPLLEPKDKIGLLAIAGSMPTAAPDDIVSAFINTIGVEPEPPGMPPGTRTRAAVAFVNTVIRPPDDDEDAIKRARDAKIRLLGGRPPRKTDDPPKITDPPIVYVQNEQPPLDYTPERLLLAIEEFADYAEHCEIWRERIMAGDVAFIDSLTKRLRSRDQKAYRVPGFRWSITEIVTTRKNGSRTDELQPPTPITQRFVEDSLEPAGQRYTQELYGHAAKCVWAAAQKLTGLTSLGIKNPIVQKYAVQLADALLDPRNQVQIRALALRIFIRRYRALVPGLAASFDDVISDLPDDNIALPDDESDT